MPKRAARNICDHICKVKGELSQRGLSFLLDFLAVRAYTLVIDKNVMETNATFAG